MEARIPMISWFIAKRLELPISTYFVWPRTVTAYEYQKERLPEEMQMVTCMIVNPLNTFHSEGLILLLHHKFPIRADSEI